MKRLGLVAVAGAMLFSVAAGNGNGGAKGGDAVCWADPVSVNAGDDYYLFATGLPTNTPLNVFVTDELGTNGFPIGVYADGNLDFLGMHAEYRGTATIQITGPTKKNMETMRIYAACSVEVLSA
jgi:hypothetical protein